MSDLGWPRRGFLNLVGLDHPASADGSARPVQLAEAGVDPRTGGAVAVTTDAALDGKDGVTRIETHYWRMLPSGEQLSEKLFDIELESGESNVLATGGSTVKTPIVVPRAVWVLGRKLYDAADEDEGRGNAEGAMHNLSRAMMAVGEVNRQMREGKLPEVAKILEECAVHDAVGERLTIVGQSPKGGFDFDAADASEAKAGGKLTVPITVARALTGFGVNTLDEHQRLQPENVRQAADPRTGTVFTTEARVDEGDNPKVSTSIAPTSVFGTNSAHATPRLTNIAWKSDGAAQCTLEELDLLGEDLTGGDQLTRMRALGVTNRILHDLRSRRYPVSMDHVVEYDLYDLVNHFEPPPPLAQGGRLTLLSVGGNNMEEIADGFGESIGGNSKVVYHEGLDKNGKIDRVGVIVDFGIHLSPKDEANIYAAPDVVEHLKHCNDILITHRHLDHADALFAYMQYGYLKGKTVHATPEVIRAIRDKLHTYPSIHPDDLPTFAPLKGEGWLHIKDKEGKTRLSVNYARNATPHSARDTPFIVHGHYDGKWIGSYLNHGDARFGRHNGDDYKGPPVDADHLDKKFFTESNQRLLAEVPGLDPKIADRRPTYFDMDITAILHKGWTPTETEVEENTLEVAGWFKDKGILLSMISTNDNRFETALRVAARANRDVTVFGSNLEKSATTANVLGVNDLRQIPAERDNNQLYLDQYFEERIWKRIYGHKVDKLYDALNAPEVSDAHRQAIVEKLKSTYHERVPNDLLTNKNHLSRFLQDRYLLADDPVQDFLDGIQPGLAKDHPFKTKKSNEFRDHKKIDPEEKREIEMEKARLQAFHQLKLMPNKFDRYQMRDMLVRAMEKQYGKQMTLGSVQVGRTSKTSRAIMGGDNSELPPGPDGRRLALLTGTQGTNAEVDAALSALSEGRSLMDGDPHNSHTARPVDPQHNVIVISQTAIPGNNGKQDEMVRKLVSRGFTVVQARNDGFQIHHIDPTRRKEIEQRLAKLGKACRVEEDGSLVVSGMAIHASGHGCEEDDRAWINLVKADVTAAQHTHDPQGGKRLDELCHAEGRRCMGRVVPNFEGISIKAGGNPQSAEIRSIGRTAASLIRVHTVRQARKYYGGHMEARRLVRHEVEGGLRSDGLRATAREGGVYETAFASIEAEAAAKAAAARNPGRPEPVPENRMAPPPERPDRGPDLPGQGFRHRLFERAQNHSAAFAARR